MNKLELEIKQFLEERGWNNLRPADLSKSISIESAELLEIFQWSNLTLDEVKKDNKLIPLIQKELADVMICCIEMSVLLELDTEYIIRTKLEKVKEKYPAQIMKRFSGKDSGSGEDTEYLKIKKQYRREGKN